MKNIYFVRHGETKSNIESRYCGWTDVPLNEAGLEQARGLLKKLRGIDLDIIYSSPLQRAKKTAEIANEAFHIDIQYDDRLKERNFGVFEDLSHSEIILKYSDLYNSLDKDWEGYVIPEGESTKDARNRVLNFADLILHESEYKNILVVSHGGCIRSLIAYMLNMNAQDEWRFKIDNAGICQVSINDKRFAYLSSLNK
jgi:alpha-ribazole phosphatase